VQSSLHAGVGQLQWVIDAYALVSAAFMLTAGTLGDLFEYSITPSSRDFLVASRCGYLPGDAR